MQYRIQVDDVVGMVDIWVILLSLPTVDQPAGFRRKGHNGLRRFQAATLPSSWCTLPAGRRRWRSPRLHRSEFPEQLDLQQRSRTRRSST